MEGEKELCVAIFKAITGSDLPTDISKGEEYTKINSVPLKCKATSVLSLQPSVQVIISHQGLRMGTILNPWVEKGCCPLGPTLN